jgi:carbon storage regulator
MLVLTRKTGETIRIGDHITVRVLEARGSQVRIGIEAPSDVKIYREEIYMAGKTRADGTSQPV